MLFRYLLCMALQDPQDRVGLGERTQEGIFEDMPVSRYIVQQFFFEGMKIMQEPGRIPSLQLARLEILQLLQQGL